jgi:alpha-D-xyloside xylohydrolase
MQTPLVSVNGLQHGERATEPWLLGNKTLALVEKIITLRYTMQDYVLDQMTAVSQTGMPVNRPLWFDFPDDPEVWDITTSYMFGDAYLVAPVTDAGVTSQTVYLPAVVGGWTHMWTNKTFSGGGNVTVPAPLGDLPIFQRTV